LPELPLRSVPRFRSRITFATFRDADLLYFLLLDFLLLAMTRLRSLSCVSVFAGIAAFIVQLR